MDDFQFKNLVKAIEDCLKANYCAMYYDDIVKKFYPAIDYDEVTAAINCMYDCDLVTFEGTLVRLVVR